LVVILYFDENRGYGKGNREALLGLGWRFLLCTSRSAWGGNDYEKTSYEKLAI